MKFHRAWVILFGCCLLQIPTGMYVNCRSIFLLPVSEALCLSLGDLSTSQLIAGVVSIVSLPLAGYLFLRIDSRVLLGGAVISQVLSVAIVSQANSIFPFYISGVLDGITTSFLRVYPIPLILGNWFSKKSGFAIGISSAFSGIFGMIGNPLINSIILFHGWRAAYLFLSIMMLLILLPVSVLLIRFHPGDVGLSPYGADKAISSHSAGIKKRGSMRVVVHMPPFWLLILGVFVISLLVSFSSYMSPIGVFAGYSATIGAWMASCCMAGNMFFKILTGWLYDRFGLNRSMRICLSAMLIGSGLLLVDSITARLIASFLFGSSMSFNMAFVPIIIRDIFGNHGYSTLLSYSSMTTTMGNALSNVLLGKLIDTLGQAAAFPVMLYSALLLAFTGSCLVLISTSLARLRLNVIP